MDLGEEKMDDLDSYEKSEERQRSESRHSEHQNHLAITVSLESSPSDNEAPQDVEAVRSRASEHHSIRRTVTAQDWTGPDDPENPHNWPMFKRVWHTAQPTVTGLAVYVFSTSHLISPTK
jgi:hypothetical protein